MHRRFSPLLAVAALGATSLCAFAPNGARAQAGSYSVVEIGRLPGMDTSYPKAVNADDPSNVQVVGNNAKSGYKKHCFYWSLATGIMDIGVVGAGSYSEALSVNRYGDVVGSSATTATGGGSHAFYWNRARGAGNLLDLNTDPDTSSSSHAISVNAVGVIAGTIANYTTGTLWAYWVPDGNGGYSAARPLPRLPDTVATNSGIGQGRIITPASDIVGTLPSSTGVSRAVVWKNLNPLTPTSPSYNTPVVIPFPYGASAGATMGAGLVTVASDGSGRLLVAGGWNNGTNAPSRGWVWAEGDSYATDTGNLTTTDGPQVWGINDRGQIAGHCTISVSTSTQLRAVAWDPLSGLLNLGTLGGTQSRAYGAHFNGMGYTINNAGQVVGFSRTSGDKVTHAFLWASATGMRDLNDITFTPGKGAFSYLQDAAGITNNGFITGSGIYTIKGTIYTTAYLLMPK